MVKVYAVLLALGFVAILLLVLGGTLAENLGRPDRDPNEVIGRRGRLMLGAVLGFSMGGMASEYSPLDLTWQLALLIAFAAGGVGWAWVRYADRIPAQD